MVVDSLRKTTAVLPARIPSSCGQPAGVAGILFGNETVVEREVLGRVIAVADGDLGRRRDVGVRKVPTGRQGYYCPFRQIDLDLHAALSTRHRTWLRHGVALAT